MDLLAVYNCAPLRFVTPAQPEALQRFARRPLNQQTLQTGPQGLKTWQIYADGQIPLQIASAI
ncbi:hypothetical protein [Tropicibacter naphthalenivorans]|uniref:hypothetical protein n=1 Tax=Tropicibacter naphthalenivorans TaxID=441103 RepID=UPI0011807622|nr:hypothetical protein [Tropicibacter naphthalenivorans]